MTWNIKLHHTLIGLIIIPNKIIRRRIPERIQIITENKWILIDSAGADAGLMIGIKKKLYRLSIDDQKASLLV